MADDVKVTISADDKPLREAFTRATKSINDFGKNASDAIEKANSYSNTMSALWAGGIAPSIQEVSNQTENATSKMSMFNQTAIGVAAGQFAFSVLNSAINFVTDSIRGSVQAFSEQEDALNRVGQALRTTGSFSESAVQDISAFATALESTSKFSDDAILGQVAFVKSLGATSQTSKDLVLAAANLSATLGGTLEDNVDKLGKTLSGTTGRLSQYIPELKSLTEEQLKAGAAADIINKRFGGAAANDLNTYSGSVAALSNSFNNLQESTGEVIAKSTLFQSIIQSLKSTVDEMNNNISANNVFDDYAKGQGIASKTSEQLANDTVILDKEIKNLQKSLEEQAARSSFSKFIFDDDTSGVIKLRMDELIKLRTDMEERLQYPRASMPKSAQDVATNTSKTNEEVEAARKRNADIVSLDAQLALQRQSLKDQEVIATIANETIRNEAEIERAYQFEIKKAEILALQKLQAAESTLTGDALADEKKKIKLEKELNQVELYGKRENTMRASLLKTRQAAESAMDAFDKKRAEDRINNQSSTFAAISTLASANNKTLAGIGKAAGIAQIAMDTPVAIGRALAAFPPPFNFVAAGLVGTAMAAQAANLAGVKFETGGIVPGMGQYGDQTQIRVNPREAVLTQDQQKEFMDIANGRGNRGGNAELASMIIDAVRNIVVSVQVDGREIGRTVRDLRSSGYAV